MARGVGAGGLGDAGGLEIGENLEGFLGGSVGSVDVCCCFVVFFL